MCLFVFCLSCVVQRNSVCIIQYSKVLLLRPLNNETDPLLRPLNNEIDSLLRPLNNETDSLLRPRNTKTDPLLRLIFKTTFFGPKQLISL